MLTKSGSLSALSTKYLQVSSRLSLFLSSKLWSTNFPQIFLLPKAAVIVDFIYSFLTFRSLVIILSVNRKSLTIKLSTLPTDSGLEVVFGRPLGGSSSISSLPFWKRLNHRNLIARDRALSSKAVRSISSVPVEVFSNFAQNLMLNHCSILGFLTAQ